MKKLRLLCCAVLLSATAAAQPSDGADTTRTMRRPEIRNNEIGLRYVGRLGVGGGSQHNMACLAVDYARYNYLNLGFRTGLEYYTHTETEGQYLAVPFHFSWRSGSGPKRRQHVKQNPDPYGYWWNGQYWQYLPPSRPSVSSILLDLIPDRKIARIGYELHGGLTPGIFMGRRAQRSDDRLTVTHRFACSVDAGVRMMIPIRHFAITLDATYRYLLTDNFRNTVLDRGAQRSSISLSAGLAMNF